MRKSLHVLAARLVFAATLLLLPSPGAAEPARDLSLGALQDGGSCPVVEGQSEERAQMMARLQERLRAEMGEPDGDVVALNGRGYRYESDRVPSIARELRILEIEMQRARAAAKGQEAPAPAQ